MLVDAMHADLAKIEISPSGLCLHWPKLDVDMYAPEMLAGAFGSKHSMAAQLGAAGGSVRPAAKACSARENGRLGRRPPKWSSRN